MTTAAERSTATTGAPPLGVDLVGRALLTLCALSTMVAFVDGAHRTGPAPAESFLTEFWRTTAYLVFAGMWAPARGPAALATGDVGASGSRRPRTARLPR